MIAAVKIPALQILARAKGGEGVKSGPIGLAVILVLCVAAYFLFKSMSKHLKRVREEFPADRAGPVAPAEPAGPGEAAQPPDPAQSPALPGDSESDVAAAPSDQPAPPARSDSA